ncbi:BnaCnng11500D [Brassica napus]|uniref:BnaCnng11500D protein n=1 Tax=Brassica napus TaxID=3708 RepID=A0A078I4X3_BRANA|nr:BnaCnng11500D [Brassica napus]
MMFVNFTGESAESLKSKFRKVATSYKGQGLSFLVVDAEGGKGALEYFGVEESQVPLVIIQTPDNKKYLKANVVVEEGRKENFQKMKGPNANSLRAHGTEYNQT